MKFKIPVIGADVEIKISELLVKEGDLVTNGQALTVLESAKSTMDIPADFDGKVTKILKEAGDEIVEGEDLLEYEAAAEKSEKTDVSSMQVKIAKEKEATDEQVKDDEPDENEQVMSTVKGVGGTSSFQEMVKEVEDEMSSLSEEKTLQRNYFKPEINKLLKKSQAALVVRHAIKIKKLKELKIYATAAAKFLITTFDIDPADIKERTSTGRIDTMIAKNYIEKHLSKSGNAVAEPTEKPLPDSLFTKYGTIERKKLSKIKQFSAKFLAKASAEVPHVAMYQDSYIDDIFGMYKKAKKSKPDIKISFLAFSVKIVAAALQKFPTMNASIDMASNEVIYKNFSNIGIAIDTPNGLVVGTIVEPKSLTIYEISEKIFDLAEKAKAGKLSADEMGGSTFTISSISGTSTKYFSPIVNRPNVGILGLCKAQYTYIVDKNKEPAIKLTMPLSLSFDHRLIDGKEGSLFLEEVKTMLEKPGDIIKI